MDAIDRLIDEYARLRRFNSTTRNHVIADLRELSDALEIERAAVRAERDEARDTLTELADVLAEDDDGLVVIAGDWRAARQRARAVLARPTGPEQT